MLEFGKKNDKMSQDELEVEKDLPSLANVIYLFISPDKPGIKFYDRSPDKLEGELTGSLSRESYITDITSISFVDWNPEENKPNLSEQVKINSGDTYTVTTIMVTESEMLRILQDISDSIDKDHIVINVKGKYKDDINNLENLKEVNEYFDYIDFNNDSIDNNVNKKM